MRGKTKNRLFVYGLSSIVIPMIIFGTILPRFNISGVITNENEVFVDIYDIFLVDYSEDPELDTNRFTIKVLLDVRNGDPNQKLIIPRINVDLRYLEKSLGKLWIAEELVLEPFRDNKSDSAGLLPIYLTIYNAGEDSGISEFFNGFMQGELGALRADLSIFLGDIPLHFDVLFSEVFEQLRLPPVEIDIADLLMSFGIAEDAIIPEDYIFLKNNSYSRDVRALFFCPNQTVFGEPHESLIFGAEEKFDSIKWETGTDLNDAVGDGTYEWEYWDGGAWKELSLSDGTEAYTKTGTIEFSKPSDWERKEIVEFFPKYYYIQCKMLAQDSGVNISINTEKSHIGNYKPPTTDSSGGFELGGSAEGYPELDPSDIPLQKGLFKTDIDVFEYFEMYNLDMNALINDFLLAGFMDGYEKVYRIPWVNSTYEDESSSSEGGESGGEVDMLAVISDIFGFLFTHNVKIGEFVTYCEFEWEEIISFMGENFQGWTAPSGIDNITQENIYAQIEQTAQFQNSIIISYIILILLMFTLFFIAPIYGRKRIDQTRLFNDISNLELYMSQVEEEMKKGVSEEDLSVLKSIKIKDQSWLEKIKFDEEEEGQEK